MKKTRNNQSTRKPWIIIFDPAEDEALRFAIGGAFDFYNLKTSLECWNLGMAFQNEFTHNIKVVSEMKRDEDKKVRYLKALSQEEWEEQKGKLKC